MEPESTVLVEDRGTTRLITLNRPDKRNAIDLILRVELAVALEAAMSVESVRVVVLTGAGKAFCSGGDISTMDRQIAEKTVIRAQAAQRVIRAIWGGSKPVIAAVEGFAFGAGVSLAMACDRVVVSEDAVLSTAFTGVGLAGDMGIFYSLPSRVGTAVARQLMMLPKRLSAVEGLGLGMVDETVPAGTALERALSDAELIAAAPPLALREMKWIWSRGAVAPMDLLDLEVEAQARLFDTEDFAEGVEAFTAKRPAVFRGR
ncbi:MULTISPECIES: enoyl-CoA hydratase/isomerase family protein [Rhodococcus]|uniref:Enoyl-CoA hydratase-related protein n=1 Tax=Rhodococcus qingshengii JCM 15477 TaxID=1303681 RepID=A0AB38RM94_RHOSG|nr:MULTISPECIES: enoyl-CoA hydratase-related protein [Rhodococcus]UPU46443.1 enoyl-CoA hydratase-related protein [Rhodococcus qingshengii JCM 15477]